jgi:mono/diheme cytochrome c family protein
MVKAVPRPLQSLVALLASAVALVGLGGCAIKHPTADLVKGKILFVEKCGACHTLAHANTTGTVGPNLDDAFRQDRIDGVKSTSIQGLIDFWIRYPDTEGVMPPMLYSGQDAQDVAAYVSTVAAKPGVDTGALATAGGVTGTTPADGKAVFTGVGGCGSCHTLAAAGTTGTVGPDLDKDLRANCASPQSKKIRGPTLQDCIHKAITDPYAYLPAGFHAGVMPSDFAKTLTKSEITALVNFLSSAAK